MLMTTRKNYYNKENRYKRRARKQRINSILAGIGIFIMMLIMSLDWDAILDLLFFN